MMRPIEIIGGGLAGLSLGLALRRSGVPVTVVEAGDYPRHRVCGEFVSGLDHDTMSRLGLEPILADALRHREVAWFFREHLQRMAVLPEPALGIDRHTLDHRLATCFVHAGGTLITRTRVADLQPHPGRVLANGRRRGRSDWLGLKVHVGGLHLARDLEMHLGREAYVGLARVGANVVNVCGLFRRHRATPAGDTHDSSDAAANTLVRYLRLSELGALADRLQSASVEPGSFCAVAALQFERPSVVTGTVRIGDAFAMTPPFTGNGMALAFQSAAAVLPMLVAYAAGERNWGDVCGATEAALRRRFGLRLTSANWLHPFLTHPTRQRWLNALSCAHLLPFRSLYALVHR